MKVIITYTFCCDNLWKSIIMALEKPGKLREFCSPTLWPLVDTDWVKKCMEYEVDGSRPRDGPKRTWREVVQKDCQAHNLNKEDAVDRSRMEEADKYWMMIRMTGG